MSDLAYQIQYLLEHDDIQSIRFLISDESDQKVQQICNHLPQQSRPRIKLIQRQLKLQQGIEQTAPIDPVQRNRLIDLHLQKKGQSSQNIIDLLIKPNQKLIYEEQFGFAFYDLFKRMLSTLGDFNPTINTIKAIHSQVQILYHAIFKQQNIEKIAKKGTNYQSGLKQVLQFVFPKQYVQFFTFSKVYKNLKKQTEEQQEVDQDDNEGQLLPNEDQTLGLQQKQFLVNLAEKISPQQYPQFNRNRTYNFMCFGLKKYLDFLGLQYVFTKQKQFCELMSFISVRFVRKVIFTIIRQRNNNQLSLIYQSITPNQIKGVGNQFVDNIVADIEKYLIPQKTVQEKACQIFINQFQIYSYRDFINSTLLQQSQKQSQKYKYIWEKSKVLQKFWIQRVKAQILLQNKQHDPNIDYLSFVAQNKIQYNNDKGKLWKKYIMIKLGFNQPQNRPMRKKIKLQSLND